MSLPLGLSPAALAPSSMTVNTSRAMDHVILEDVPYWSFKEAGRL
jgi:hypothetical protein